MNKLCIKDLTKKKLNEMYLSLTVLENEIDIKKNDVIEKTIVYTLVGVDMTGRSNIINIFLDKISIRFWIDCFEKLKYRGINNIFFLVSGNHKEIRKAAKIAFPNIISIDSVSHITPKFYQFYTDRSTKDIAGKITKLYTQNTLTDYDKEILKFNQLYNSPIHKKLIDKYLKNVKEAYKYSLNLRKLLYTHSRNTTLYDIIRLNFKNKYISEIEDILSVIEEKAPTYGIAPSFRKPEVAGMISDLCFLYPDIEFI